MPLTTVGVDIAKNVIQLHYIDAETGELINKPMKRALFLEHFTNRAPCLIGMEACGGSQHWARKLMAMGHEVKLMLADSTGRSNTFDRGGVAWCEVQSRCIG